MVKVAVIGAKGRMGSTVCTAVEAAGDMEVVARLDAGDAINEQSLAGASVAVVFTVPSVKLQNVLDLLAAGVHAVVGTSGWSDEELERVRAAQAKSAANVFIAPNFALSAVLAMEFAAKAAPLFESVEIVEIHHPNKVDAPSGTAVATAQKISRARKQAGCAPMPDATQTDPQGARGSRYEGVPVHALRLRGMTATEEVLLGNPGEVLTIRTDSFDRASFMPGVLLAVRKIADTPGVTAGLEHLLDL
ncbi:4-hydroxy-tetrahydrodipicolinate reductase [Gleimia europaea]|uniref:4-hydroxy-tetrahydrodipicolinate reductase n=2 Tax=Actinomycetaceae TaxID=2049 RepID=A0A9W5VW66_9ACTO|nr:4-hydroxy-tetrahydrodipicolinate reductase [Gleimia europaea]EPD30606.1 dihydrodipicolinate reductase [Gleimia europaea ACS-120-V-Col10b]